MLPVDSQSKLPVETFEMFCLDRRGAMLVSPLPGLPIDARQANAAVAKIRINIASTVRIIQMKRMPYIQVMVRRRIVWQVGGRYSFCVILWSFSNQGMTSEQQRPMRTRRTYPLPSYNIIYQQNTPTRTNLIIARTHNNSLNRNNCLPFSVRYENRMRYGWNHAVNQRNGGGPRD